ncbi:hypothetical protein [Corynebacterium uterequi]|uniref:Uncharacterized protein n=1 Tax=Corynebacterium uterequi TaxID=1072256 RepID=A0A0G3HE75_9CORY|nr:hypothetical protein [Corynebacterium uterequi]AKK10253.1 hypothetical protein CUTER_01165 [Corynebacterium uterequi]
MTNVEFARSVCAMIAAAIVAIAIGLIGIKVLLLPDVSAAAYLPLTQRPAVCVTACASESPAKLPQAA